MQDELQPRAQCATVIDDPDDMQDQGNRDDGDPGSHLIVDALLVLREHTRQQILDTQDHEKRKPDRDRADRTPEDPNTPDVRDRAQFLFVTARSFRIEHASTPACGDEPTHQRRA